MRLPSFFSRRRASGYRLLRTLVAELAGIRAELARANDQREGQRRGVHSDPRANVFVTGTPSGPAGLAGLEDAMVGFQPDAGTLADYYEVAVALRALLGREPSEEEVEAEYQLRKLPLATRREAH